MKTNKSKYPENSGFKVPEAYFESFEARMLGRIKEEKSSALPPAGNAFRVPDGYFDKLEDQIISKTPVKKSRVINLFKKEYLAYAAAVAAIFVLMLGNFFKTGSNDPLGWDDIEVSAMENYIDEGYEMGYIDLNSSEYSEFISKDGMLIDETDFDEMHPEAVFDYIDENIEDPTYILE